MRPGPTTTKSTLDNHLELIISASCAGRFLVNLRTLRFSVTSYARYGSICDGTHVHHDQSNLRNGLDVTFGTRAGLPARNMTHLCVATNPKPLKQYGLYCYLDLRVAILELNLINGTYSKTAQMVVAESRVPPQALHVSRKSPYDLGSLCLPSQADLVLSRGREADQASAQKKIIGRIFKASPLVRPRPQGCPLRALLLLQRQQPIIIPDDDVRRCSLSGSASSGSCAHAAEAATEAPPSKKRPMLKPAPSSRPRAVLKSAPNTPKVPPPVEQFVVPISPPISQLFGAADFPMVLPRLRHRDQKFQWQLCHHQRHLLPLWVRLPLQLPLPGANLRLNLQGGKFRQRLIPFSVRLNRGTGEADA